MLVPSSLDGVDLGVNGYHVYSLTFRCLCAVGIWAETELDSRIVDKSSSINNFLDSVLNSESASVRLTLFVPCCSFLELNVPYLVFVGGKLHS